MPRGDRTGPAGFGPMSGRGFGYCAGYGAPGYVQPAPGRGFGGCGRGAACGGGRGWRHRFFAAGPSGWRRMMPGGGAGVYPGASPMSAEQELGALKAQAEQLQTTLEEIRRRMEELKSRPPRD